MEHSSHAHPLPDERILSPYASCTIPSPITLASQQQNEGPSQQTRRLQLRNAGFRAPLFPNRRISPMFIGSPAIIEPSNRIVGNENSPLNAEKRSLYGEDLPPSPVNILQEIQKSTRKRSSPRSEVGAIFQVHRASEDTNETSVTPWVNKGRRNRSPAPSHTPVNMMKLREGSLNQRTPPPHSAPLKKQVKGRNRKQAHLRSASSEAAEYIEHLESQLASVNAKLDSLTSPTTNKLRSAKLRALIVESRNLRLEVSEWEKKFAVRVQDERDERLGVEMELKLRLQTLTEDTEIKDARIAELEWELESMRVQVRDADGLQEVNMGLEKRIEVLTNLLVQSPTKLDGRSTTTSPNKTDPSKRTARPRSMLPRVPPSPGGVRLSLSTVSESAFWASQSLQSPISVAESPEGGARVEADEQGCESPAQEEGIRSPYYSTQARLSGSSDNRSRASASFRSVPSSGSRPTSLRSSCSFGPSSWGLPLLADIDSKSTSKQRKMRRFPSGSVSLRPLILPAATVVPSLPASAPLFPSIKNTARRDISEVSLDPTTSFLSRPADSSPVSTPIQSARHRSTSWAQEQTLKALEGRFSDVERLGEDHREHAQGPISEPMFIDFEEIPSEKRKRRSRPRSLHKELEEAADQQAVRAQAADSPEMCEDGLIPLDTVSSPESGQIFIGMDPTPSKAPLPIALSGPPRLSMKPDYAPKPAQSLLPTVFATPQVKTHPSTLVITQHAHGIFARLTNLISQTKQDSFVLARRLLSNAWAQGSKRLGGMGWWLLGLVYGTRWRKRKRTADNEVDESIPSRDFDWRQFSADASRSRAAEHYFRHYGGCALNPAITTTTPWPSPPHLSHSEPVNVPPIRPHRHEPHLFPCNDCVEPSSRRTFRLWFQFSLAMVLAVGVAIRHGPASLLAELSTAYQRPPHTHPHQHQHERAQEREPLLKGQRQRQDSPSSPSSVGASNGIDSGYGSITFAETLGPADFEPV